MKEELKKSIKDSGNQLHLKVARLLEKEGWTVQISPYYVDELTAAPREIDIVASLRIPIKNTFGKEKDYFWIHIIVECKHLTKEAVFYEFGDKPPFSAVKAIRIGNLKRSEIIDNKAFASDHHYVKAGTSARLYDIERGEISSNTDDIYKSITQAIKALIFEEHSFQGKTGGRALFYPVVVYEGIDGIWSLSGTSDPDPDKAELKKRNLYTLQYGYRDLGNSDIRKELFIVDYVHWDALPELLTDIHEDKTSLFKDMEFRILTQR